MSFKENSQVVIIIKDHALNEIGGRVKGIDPHGNVLIHLNENDTSYSMALIAKEFIQYVH